MNGNHPGPLGFILPIDRTREQEEAHNRAMAILPRFSMPYVEPPGPKKLMLTDAWKHPDVIADLGLEFTGFGQRTGSCFPAGTPVRMADGSEKPIEDVKAGDQVITHVGRVRRVTQTMQRDYTGEMFTFLVSGFPFPLEMTADHQIAIASSWAEGGIEWKRADEVEEGDRVLIGWNRHDAAPQSLDMLQLLGEKGMDLDELMKENAYTKGNEPDVPNSNFNSARKMVRQSGMDWHGKVRLHQSRVENAIFRHIPVCHSLARLIGLYLAEGGCHEGRVTFTFNADEKSLAGEVLALVRGIFGVEGEEVYQSQRPNTLKVKFQNRNLAEVFKALMPGNVYTKRVPSIFFGANEETRLELLLGWMAGDGFVGIKGGKTPGNVRITGVTVCAGLARDMTTLALSCGLRATTTLRKARKQSRVSYSVDLAGRKAVSLFPAVAARANASRYDRDDKASHTSGYARKVRSIKSRPVETLPVFDFEVEEDHSFVAGGLIVHNCVGVSEGDGITTVACIQRLVADTPTKAFICFWPFPYGRTRFNEGDRGQGEGAVDSVMGDTLVKEGFFDINQPGLPTFTTGPDGFWLSGGSSVELQWSDGARIAQKWMDLALPNAGMTKSIVNDVAGIRAAILNGYAILDGCDNYIGSGKIKGSGADAYAVGHYDGAGGHSTCYLGVWDHPNDGPLYLYSNQWDTSTYPKDPAGAGRCCVWVPEAEVAKLFRTGGSGGETMALSHTKGTPVQPRVLEVLSWTM